MARAISDEELSLKKRARRRLIGAIILVTAVVVVLPMILDSEPKPDNQDVSIRIPSPDATPFNPKVAPVIPAAPAVKSAPAAEPKAAAPTPAARLSGLRPSRELVAVSRIVSVFGTRTLKFP